MKRRWRRWKNCVLYTIGNLEIILTVARNVRGGGSLNDERLSSSRSLRFDSLRDNICSCSLSRGRLVFQRTCLNSLERIHFFKISYLFLLLKQFFCFLHLGPRLNPLGSGTQTLRNWNQSRWSFYLFNLLASFE